MYSVLNGKRICLDGGIAWFYCFCLNRSASMNSFFLLLVILLFVGINFVIDGIFSLKSGTTLFVFVVYIIPSLVISLLFWKATFDRSHWMLKIFSLVASLGIAAGTAGIIWISPIGCGSNAECIQRLEANLVLYNFAIFFYIGLAIVLPILIIVTNLSEISSTFTSIPRLLSRIGYMLSSSHPPTRR